MAFEESEYKKAKSKEKNKRQISLVKLLVWILAIVAGGLVINFCFGIVMEYVQIKEIGVKYVAIFWKNIQVRLVAQFLSFLAIFVLFMANNIVIRKISLKDNEDLDIIRRFAPSILTTFIIAFIASRFISDTVYTRFLVFANHTPFYRIDPVFNQDIGYYLFQRPFLMSLFDSIKAIFIVQTVYTAVIYMILQARGGIENFKDIFKNRAVMTHNIVNFSLIFIIIALTFKYSAEEILYGDFNNLFGAGFVDIQVWLKYYEIAPYLILASVAATVILLKKGLYKWCLASVGAMPAVWIVTLVIAGIVQTFVVAPNDVAVETPNILNNIHMTREAYSLDDIYMEDYAIDNTLTAQDLVDHDDTVGNIRIMDFHSTVTSLNMLQGLRPYYTFTDTDIATYDVNGKPMAVSMAARELDSAKIASNGADAYTNKTFKYTHGYGVVANPINRLTSEGQPEFIIRDMPVKSDAGIVNITQPRIYYGEMTNEHVIVNTHIKELDYSDGQNNVEFSYDGVGGVRLDAMSRFMFSVMYGDYKMLVSGQITKDSKILPNRNIIERVKMVAPFFEYDIDPYIIVTDDGKLRWIIDGYATSAYFPYAQRSDKINYIRNSLKVVVDAYDGTVDFYISDYSDPIVLTYAKIYPNLFNPNPIPHDIAKHIRYPERLFKIQAEMFKRYHLTDPQVFYNRSDIWDVAREKYSKTEVQYIEPYYNMMKIRGFDEKGEGMLLTMPYTIASKDYINGWLAVGSDSKYYGKMVFYRFTNAEKNAYGTLQIENRIDSDTTISEQMTLWGQGGSSVVRGNMIVIPIKDSLLYIEPVYITTQNNASFPELKRVIVAYKENIVMEPTLQDAFNKLFGVTDTSTAPPETQPQAPPQTNAPDSQTQTDDLLNLVDLYAKYKEYNAAGDFENAGKTMQEIDKILGLIETELRQKQ